MNKANWRPLNKKTYLTQGHSCLFTEACVSLFAYVAS